MTLRGIAIAFVVAAGITTGCATGHATMRGSIVMKIDPTKAHVCLGTGEVAVNDRVRLYRNVCQPSVNRSPGPTSPGARTSVCTKETVADGTITELIDEHYSVATFPAGTVFEEGNTVEKL